MSLSRRLFLSLPLGALLEASEKGKKFASPAKPYRDAATDAVIVRLTDPAFSSWMGPHYAYPVSRRGTYLLICSDAAGEMNVFRLDYKSGEARQLTEAGGVQPGSATFSPDGREFYYVTESGVFAAPLNNLRSRELYRFEEGFEPVPGLSISEDGKYAALIERKGTRHRLRLIHTDGRTPRSFLVEANEEMRDPVLRPRQSSVLYWRASGLWLTSFDGRQNERLRTAEGQADSATWSPDGRTVLYLNLPAEKGRLNTIREFAPETGKDEAVASTSQFAIFACNSDASMFVGASASKASPYVLLLARAVKRELTLCEHRASNARMVAPVFSPNSQRIFFTSDQQGKPAVYSMLVDKLVADTAPGDKDRKDR
jgi:oligogalacturonide lyase